MIKNRNTLMCLEDKAEAPGDQSRSGLSSTRKKAYAEPTIAGVSQVEDASGMSGWKQPVDPGGSERELSHTEASQEEPGELQTQEQALLARSGRKQSSRAVQEGPGELEAGWEQTQPKLGEDSKGLPQPDIETNDQQGGQKSPGMVEDQSPESCQVALPEPGPGACEDSSQEAVPPPPMVTTERETIPFFLPPMPGPQIPKGGGKVEEILPTPRPLPPPERDIDKKKELDQAQKRLLEAIAVAGVRSSRNTQTSFMKCLLEVEEQEQATHRRALKAQTLMSWRFPRTLTSVHNPGPVSNSATPQTSTSAPVTISLWSRPLVPGSSPAPVGTSAAVLPTHTRDLGSRWPELGHQTSERSLSYATARQESEEHNRHKLGQSREEQSEEHLTLKQEEAFRSYFEIFNGPGEIDAPSLKNILRLIDLPLSPAQVNEALKNADVNGDGHVDFKDFLAVMTDKRRFFCSVEQNVLLDMSPMNPSTLFFDILSLLVEMLALPEAALEEITNYYQKMKEGSFKTREMEWAKVGLQSWKKLPYNPQQRDSLEASERRVLRILSRLKQQNYAANLQGPYAQVPSIPLCPRLEKMTHWKHGSRSTLEHCTSTGLSTDLHVPFFQSGPQGSREHSSDSKKWLSSVPARIY